ncbi:MAG: hypothetical protein COB76_06540 [Alphaproteobacteria bacterium]|nr:MAG: hypothetical protein COB76_06540 [Alphaproteobacteria bacterium]
MALEYKRLSDRILFAFELSVEQGDIDISDALMKALDKAITRSAGGVEFSERRDLAPEYQAALSQYEELKAQQDD